MLAKIYSAAVYGVDAYEIEIEVNGAGGDPAIIIVGLPDAAVKESRDRVTTAIANSGYHWPRGRTTINLAPADIKKEGPSFDLPIALGMIAVERRDRHVAVRKFRFCRRACAGWRGAPGQGRAAGCARSAATRQTRFFRSGSQRSRSRHGGQDRHLWRAKSARDISVSPRRDPPAARRAAISRNFFARIRITTSISATSKARATSSVPSKWPSPAATTFS